MLVAAVAVLGAGVGTTQEQVIVPHTTGELVVVVREARNGRPIERATVTASSTFVALTKANGVAVLQHLPTSVGLVMAGAFGYFSELCAVKIRADAAETLEADLWRERGSVLIGDTAWTPRPVPPPGSGRSDVWVQVLDGRDSSAVRYANVVIDTREAVLTDVSGKAVVRGLAAGLHTVMIRASGYKIQSPDSFMLKANEFRMYRHMLGGRDSVKE
jgi:hypothetical protein